MATEGTHEQGADQPSRSKNQETYLREGPGLAPKSRPEPKGSHRGKGRVGEQPPHRSIPSNHAATTQTPAKGPRQTDPHSSLNLGNHGSKNAFISILQPKSTEHSPSETQVSVNLNTLHLLAHTQLYFSVDTAEPITQEEHIRVTDNLAFLSFTR